MAITDLIPWKKPENRLGTMRRTNDPFSAWGKEIDQMFGGWTNGLNLFDVGSPTFAPTIDLKETNKDVRITAELPGMEEKDIEVSVLDGILNIKGEKKEEHEEENGTTYRCERKYGAFERVISLPAEVDADKAKASFKKGVLNISLPKTERAQSRRRLISVQT